MLEWNFDETSLYLAVAHSICEYSVQRHIFEITSGYPIITYFLAEHYKQYGNINIETPVADLNQYYEELLYQGVISQKDDIKKKFHELRKSIEKGEKSFVAEEWARMKKLLDIIVFAFAK